MSTWNIEPDPGSLGLPGTGDVEHGNAANLGAVLVVGKSNITRVVVSRIVERSGLRPVAESPEGAQRALSRVRPGTVILDGGADNCDCSHLYACLGDQRRASGRNVPRVILLSTRTGTPENLQPVVHRLLETARP